MLTDEEKREIWDNTQNNYTNWSGFADAIERAVLAKAMPITKQEPVASRRKDFMGNYVYRNEMILGNEPLYADPQPAQAAAIPEGWVDEWKNNVMRLWVCARKNDSSIPDDQLDFMRDMLLSASPKPE